MSEVNVGAQELEMKPTAVDFKSELKPIFDPLFSTVGHGTRVEAAKKIMKQGLKTKTPDLLSTTKPLFDSTKTYEEQAAQLLDTLEHWPHFDLKAIVVIMIPNPKKEEPGGSRYFNSVFEKLPEKNTGYNTQFVIPRKYIKGYVDVEKKQFISNPNFNPEKLILKPLPSTSLSELLESSQDAQALQNIVTVSKDKKNPTVW